MLQIEMTRMSLGLILVATMMMIVPICDGADSSQQPDTTTTRELDKEGEYISKMFTIGFKFETYAEFESFFQQKLPQYNQDIRLNLKRPSKRLVSSPIYAYASYKFDIEPVKKLYDAYYKSDSETLIAMKNIDQLWSNGDDRFKQLTQATVNGLLRAIVWNQLQGLTERLFRDISTESVDRALYNKLKTEGWANYKLTPKMERLQSEMCNLLSGGQYQNLALEVDDSQWFDCESVDNLREFLRQFDNEPRVAMSKLAKYVVGVSKLNKAIVQVNEDNLTHEDIVREQPHQKFARELKQQLEPTFGVIELAMRLVKDSNTTDTEEDYQRLVEKMESRLNKNEIIQYWHLAYKICQLVLSVRFGKSKN